MDERIGVIRKALRDALGTHLRHIVLFGSAARGEMTEGSDYDCLVVVVETSAEITDRIDKVAGQFLYDTNRVLSAFPVSEKQMQSRPYSPLLMNVRKEGIPL